MMEGNVNDLTQDMMEMYAVSPEMEAQRLANALDDTEDAAVEFLKAQGWRHKMNRYDGTDTWWESKTGDVADTLEDALWQIGGVR